MLVDRFGVSERRACRVAGQHRSTQRLTPRPRPEAEEKVRQRLREIARKHPRWGWKTAHTRSCAARVMSSTASVTIIERLVAEPGAPEHLRMDNGPEMIAWALRDWCRLHHTTTSYIEPGSPWENPFVESFNGRARDELLNIEEFGTLLEAQVAVKAWRIEYNTYRPHSSLGGLTPAV